MAAPIAYCQQRLAPIPTAVNRLTIPSSPRAPPGSPGYIALEGGTSALAALRQKLTALPRDPLFALCVGWAQVGPLGCWELGGAGRLAAHR